MYAGILFIDRVTPNPNPNPARVRQLSSQRADRTAGTTHHTHKATRIHVYIKERGRLGGVHVGRGAFTIQLVLSTRPE